MSTNVIDQLREERDSSRDAAISMAEQADFDPKSESFVALEERAASLDTQIERLSKLMDARQAADTLDGKLSKAQRRQDEAAAKPETREGWGEQFVRSAVWGEYSFRGTSHKVEVQTRALPHSLTSMADALPASPIYDLSSPVPPPLLVPLTNVVTVSGNSIDYIVWVKAAGAAAVVAEGTLKPAIEWEPSVTSSSLDTIAGSTSFTRQLAEDAAAVVSFINGELQAEVGRKVEAEAKAALVAAVLPTATGPAGKGLLGAIRAGMADVQAAGYSPNGFLVSSDDLIDLDLEVMATAGTGPNRTSAFWGLSPVVDPGATSGTVIVGDFKAGVQHYRRNSVQLFVTDSHASNFTLNILDAIAEQRAKTVVTRPAALCEATAGA